MTTILLSALLPVLAWLWFDFMRAREAAENGARDYCRREGLQLLDDTVTLARLRLSRYRGRLRFCRLYGFEYTDTGHGRYLGYVALSGRHVLEVDLVPRRIH